MALRLLNSGGIPEIEQLFDRMSWRLSLYKPDQLDGVLLDGVPLDQAQQRLSEQVSRLQRRARALDGMPVSRASSPVDSALNELELLKAARQLTQ